MPNEPATILTILPLESEDVSYSKSVAIWEWLIGEETVSIDLDVAFIWKSPTVQRTPTSAILFCWNYLWNEMEIFREDAVVIYLRKWLSAVRLLWWFLSTCTSPKLDCALFFLFFGIPGHIPPALNALAEDSSSSFLDYLGITSALDWKSCNMGSFYDIVLY